VLMGTSYEARMQQLRAGVRLNSHVPLVVEWTEGGQKHTEAGYTVDVSPKGCLAIVPQGFAVGQRLRLLNKVTGRESEAILIWRGHEGRRGWELGLELQGPPEDFWGVEL
jgi:PilZ domain